MLLRVQKLISSRALWLLMKLQKVVSLVAYGHTYHKWLISIPETTIRSLAWEKGDDLNIEVKNGSLNISKVSRGGTPSESQSPRLKPRRGRDLGR